MEVNGPQDMTALRQATVCIPAHSNDLAGLQRHRTANGVGTLIGGLISANMPDDFANKTNAEKEACCWSMKHAQLISKCADKVKAGLADAILDEEVSAGLDLTIRVAAPLITHRAELCGRSIDQ